MFKIFQPLVIFYDILFVFFFILILYFCCLWSKFGGFSVIILSNIFPKVSSFYSLGFWCHKCETFWYSPAGKRELFNSYTRQTVSSLSCSDWTISIDLSLNVMTSAICGLTIQSFWRAFYLAIIFFSSQISTWFLFIFISLLRLSIFSLISSLPALLLGAFL